MMLEQLSCGESDQDADAEAGGYQPEKLKIGECVNTYSRVVSIVLGITLNCYQVFRRCTGEAASSSKTDDNSRLTNLSGERFQGLGAGNNDFSFT